MKNKYNLQVFTEKDTYFDILNKCNNLNYIDYYKFSNEIFKQRRIKNIEFGIEIYVRKTYEEK